MKEEHLPAAGNPRDWDGQRDVVVVADRVGVIRKSKNRYFLEKWSNQDIWEIFQYDGKILTSMCQYGKPGPALDRISQLTEEYDLPLMESMMLQLLYKFRLGEISRHEFIMGALTIVGFGDDMNLQQITRSYSYWYNHRREGDEFERWSYFEILSETNPLASIYSAIGNYMICKNGFKSRPLKEPDDKEFRDNHYDFLATVFELFGIVYKF